MAVQSFLVRSAPCGGGGMYLIFAPVLRVKGVEMLKAFKLDSRLHVLIFALGFGVMLAVVAIGALLAAAYIVQFNAIVAGMALTAGLGTLAVAFLQGRANTSSPSENKEKK